MAGCQLGFKVAIDLYISRFRGLFSHFSAPNLWLNARNVVSCIGGFREKGCSWEEGLWRCKHGRRIGACSRIGWWTQEVGVLRKSVCSGGIACNDEFRRSAGSGVSESVTQTEERRRGVVCPSVTCSGIKWKSAVPINSLQAEGGT
jgi:hypothetical protein